jgi:acetylornithine deacetylase/succinyl-diaminopimelate desuccinylase-like protein
LKRPFIDRLATAVAIPSVSSDAAYRPEVHKMGKWLASELEALGVKYYHVRITLIETESSYDLSGSILCKV